jgi:hypothetical protein
MVLILWSNGQGLELLNFKYLQKMNNIQKLISELEDEKQKAEKGREWGLRKDNLLAAFNYKNLDMKQILEVANWFIKVKAPDLKDKINAGLKMLEAKEPLQDGYKKLFGFMIFSFSMNHGPASFFGAEALAKEIDVLEEMKSYAKNWISHSKKTVS